MKETFFCIEKNGCNYPRAAVAIYISQGRHVSFWHYNLNFRMGLVSLNQGFYVLANYK